MKFPTLFFLLIGLVLIGVLSQVYADNRNVVTPNPTTGPSSGIIITHNTPCTSSLAFEERTDRPGQDYRSEEIRSNDPCACAILCENDDTCQAFTYVPSGIQGTSAMCWLKNAVPAAVPNQNTISGIKSESEVTIPAWNIYQCPSDLPIPDITVSRGDRIERGIVYPITVTNSAEFPDDLFSCRAYGCQTIIEMIYNDGTTIRWPRNLSGREDLATGLVAFSPGGAPFMSVQLRITIPECNLSVTSSEVLLPSDDWFTVEPNGTPSNEEHNSFSISPCNTEPGTDRPGNDFRSFPLTSADPCECSRLCQENGSCAAFTYVEPGIQGSSAMCYLKNDVPTPVSNAHCISGIPDPR